MRPYLFFSALLTLAGLGPGSAAASAQVLLAGTVREFETETPIAGAFVEVLNLQSRRIASRMADDSGAFLLTVPRREGYRIRVSRIGYRETTTPVLWRDGFDRISIDVRMAADALILAPLEVVARSLPTESPVLEDFRARVKIGFGEYITRDQITQRKPGLISDMLAHLPSVTLQSAGRGMRRTIWFSRGTHQCPALIYVDGFLLNRRGPDNVDYGFTLDDAVSPSEVEGVEVYRGVSSVPPEFLTPEADCGVVAIWTRRGDRGG